jgi:hypothetical protein
MQTQTVFSHIVQKCLSQEYENVATEALVFALHSSEKTRNGMMKLLRGIEPSIPALWFRTQQTEGGNQPDMVGYDEYGTHVFVENKFWAGLTENQPVGYLNQLAKSTQPSVLLVVGPDAREHTLWRELKTRLDNAGISATNRETATGIVHSIKTEIGPILALTSWTRLLSALELEVMDDRRAISDLLQLRALCDAVDSDSFAPISSEQVTNQQTPAFLIQLTEIVQASVDLAVTEGILSIKRLLPQASWDRIGRYARFSSEQGIGTWFGIDFGLWKKHGVTPLWLFFGQDEFSRADEVRSLIGPWAAKEGIFTTSWDDSFVIAVDIAISEDKDEVVRSVVTRLKAIGVQLQKLNP